MSVARILKAKPGCVSANSLSTIARVYGSSPVEHAALQTSSGLRAAFDGHKFRDCGGGQEFEVPRLTKEIGLIGSHYVDQMNQLVAQAFAGK